MTECFITFMTILNLSVLWGIYTINKELRNITHVLEQMQHGIDEILTTGRLPKSSTH